MKRKGRTKKTKRFIEMEVTSVISHQFKTPLAGIKSALEVILSGELGSVLSQQEEYLRIALENTGRMITLVKELLDASRIEEGRMELTLQSADLVRVVKEVISDLSLFAKAKNTVLTYDIEGTIPLVKMDAVKIQQVAQNIIHNAIRYNKGKGIVEVKLKHTESMVLFSCRDSGIGLSKEETSKIFSRFYRSEDAVALSPIGSGLGLYIAKAIIEESGGKIWFMSEKGKGTTFYFTLPVE